MSHAGINGRPLRLRSTKKAEWRQNPRSRSSALAELSETISKPDGHHHGRSYQDVIAICRNPAFPRPLRFLRKGPEITSRFLVRLHVPTRSIGEPPRSHGGPRERVNVEPGSYFQPDPELPSVQDVFVCRSGFMVFPKSIPPRPLVSFFSRCHHSKETWSSLQFLGSSV